MIDRNSAEWDRHYALLHIRRAEAEHTRTEGRPITMTYEQRRVLLGIKSDWDASRIARALNSIPVN
jgi:hypothetical protein